MFKEFLKVFAKALAAGPALVAICMGLSAAAKESGFDQASPKGYAELLNIIKILLGLVIDHVIGYIALCAFASFIWIMLVTEPKVKSKKRFEARRRDRIGDKR